MVTYVELNGYKQGRPQKESNMDCLSLDEIAKQLGTSKTNLKRALSIERNLTEPMKKLLDDGIISKTVAADLISSKLFSILNDTLERGKMGERGEIGGSAKKVGKRIKELERLYGIRNGSANEKGDNRIGEPNNSVDQRTQSDLAAQMGMSVDTLQNYKMLAEMTDFYWTNQKISVIMHIMIRKDILIF